MADNDVQVTVGLSLENLQSGVREAANSIDILKKGMQTLAGAFAVREIADFVTHMTELGDKAESAAAILGVSSEKAQQLSIMSRLAGGSGDELTTSLTRMQVGLQRGQELTSAQAAAFKALGVNAKELANIPADQQLGKLADAVKKLHDQGINAAPALALISRGLAQMMPYLVGGSQEIQYWQQRMKEAGAVLSEETTKKLSDTNKEFVLLKAAMEGLGATFVSANSWIKSLATQVSYAAGNLTTLIAQGNLLGYMFGWVSGYADLLGAKIVKLSIAFANFAGALVGGIKWSEIFTKDMERANAAIAAADAELKQLNADFEKNKALFISGLGGGAGQTPLNVDLGLGKAQKDALKIAEEQYREQEALAKGALDSFQITEAQKVQILRNALLQREQAEIAAGENINVAERKYAADIEKLNAEAAKKTADMWKAAADQLASDINGALDQVLSRQRTVTAAIGEMFGKMLKQMLADLIKVVLEWTILNAVQAKGASFSALAEKSFPLLGGLLGGGGAATTGASAAAQAANTAALTANTTASGVNTGAHTAGTAATTAGTAATAAQTTATATQSAATFEGTSVTLLHTAVTEPLTAATTLNTTATVANTAAEYIKAAFGAIGMATGAWNVGTGEKFPSYDAGTMSIPGTQLALLHAGEMVVPAGPASQIRAGMENGSAGGVVNLSISALDAGSFAAWLRNGGGNMLSRYLSQQWQNNPSMRPGYSQ